MEREKATNPLGGGATESAGSDTPKVNANVRVIGICFSGHVAAGIRERERAQDNSLFEHHVKHAFPAVGFHKFDDVLMFEEMACCRFAFQI